MKNFLLMSTDKLPFGLIFEKTTVILLLLVHRLLLLGYVFFVCCPQPHQCNTQSPYQRHLPDTDQRIAGGGEMKTGKQHRKIAGYISLQVAEVYLGKIGGSLPFDILPFEEDKLPQNTKEAF